MCSFLDWCYIIYMHCLTKRVLIGVKICEKNFFWGGWREEGSLGVGVRRGVGLARGVSFGFIARRWGHAPTLRICCILSHILARSLMRSLTCNRRTILPGGAGTWDVTCDGLEEWFSYYIIFTYGRVFYAGTIVYVWTVFLRGTVVFTCVLFLYVWTGVLRGAIFSGTVFCGRRGFRSCSLRRWRG